MPDTRLLILIAACFSITSSAFAQSLPDLRTLSGPIEPQVAMVRSLSFNGPYDIRYRSNTEIRAFFRGAIRNALTPAYLDNYDLIIRTMGLHRGGPSLGNGLEALTGSAESQVAAYYDPAEGTITFPRRDLGEPGFQEVIAHELVHVLQDQTFGLLALTEGLESSDAIGARQALVEGEAFLVQILWVFGSLLEIEISPAELDQLIQAIESQTARELKLLIRQQAEQAGDSDLAAAVDATPDYLIDQQLGAYNRGLAFVHHIRKQGGWAAVDDLWAKPPLSMEHILDPRTYLDGQTLEDIRLPDLSGDPLEADWEQLDDDTLGELGFRIIFDTYSVGITARNAAKGWHGDRYGVYRHRQTNALAFVLFTTWDTEIDATQFETAYRKVASIKHGTTGYRIERQGLDVLVAESPTDLDDWFAYLERVRFVPPELLIPFDFDGDLTIGFGDFLLFAVAFGSTTADASFEARFDTDGDGAVGFPDFLAFAAVFGKTIEPAAGKQIPRVLPHVFVPNTR